MDIDRSITVGTVEISSTILGERILIIDDSKEVIQGTHPKEDPNSTATPSSLQPSNPLRWHLFSYLNPHLYNSSSSSILLGFLSQLGNIPLLQLVKVLCR